MLSFGILRRIALMPFIGSLELGIAWVHAMVIYTTYPALVLSIPKDMSAMPFIMGGLGKPKQYKVVACPNAHPIWL